MKASDTTQKFQDSSPSVAKRIEAWEIERELRNARRTAVYVSAPVTTGRKFIEWYESTGHQLENDGFEYDRALRAEVILPNIQRAARFLELLRWRNVGLVIDPISLDVPGWSQSEYREFWMTIIDRHARRVIFLEGWEYSSGCVLEFEKAQCSGIDCVTENLEPLSLEYGLQLLKVAIDNTRQVGGDTSILKAVFQRLRNPDDPVPEYERRLYKDEVLDHLAWTANVAQFVSFDPRLQQRFCRILGYSPNHKFPSLEDAISALLQSSPEAAVNIRTYNPKSPEGNPLLKNLKSLPEVIGNLRRMGDQGLFSIVNEVIDERDGGVSGVCYRGLLEFSPDANPRCVDDDDIETATLPVELGLHTLSTVYGFEPDLRGREGARVEFSIHPNLRGWGNAHTIIWQMEQRPALALNASIGWPNAFSRLLGDKAFGLTLAAAAGFAVPRTVVYCRRLFPYVLGSSTGTRRFWTRPSPETKEPGYYPSSRGWHDPYEVLSGSRLKPPVSNDRVQYSPLASVLIQESVTAVCSGRAVPTESDDVMIRGTLGEGDSFMVGEEGEAKLPDSAIKAVEQAYNCARRVLGPISIEWVFDGTIAWIVQINPSRPMPILSHNDQRSEWIDFQYRRGRLEDFREQVMTLRGSNKGIVVRGRVSPLSHLGEIAENNHVPVVFLQS